MKLKVGDIVLVDGDARNQSLYITRINYKRNKVWCKPTVNRYVWQCDDNGFSIDLNRLVLAETVLGCIYYKPQKTQEKS